MTETVITNALAAASIAKILVDILRMAFPNRPDWVSPLLAVLFGIGASVLLLLTQDVELTRAALAQAVLAGVLAGGSAVGITQLQRQTS